MSKNDVTMAYRINKVPRNATVEQVFQTLIKVAAGGEMPSGYDVTWKWRNTPKQDMRDDTMQNAVGKSRAGFLALMRRRLLRDAARAVPGFQAPELPELSEDDVEDYEEWEEEMSEYVSNPAGVGTPLQCLAITKSGKRCKRKVESGSYCWQHKKGKKGK